MGLKAREPQEREHSSVHRAPMDAASPVSDSVSMEERGVLRWIRPVRPLRVSFSSALDLNGLRFKLLATLLMGMGLAYLVIQDFKDPLLLVNVLGGALGFVLYQKNRDSTLFKTLWVVILSIFVWTFYHSTGNVIRTLGLPIEDASVIHLEEILFSWIFAPSGHASIWLDQNTWIGPHTGIGKAISEVLQAAYFSYYFWGYGMLLMLLVAVNRRNDKKSEANLVRFLCAWLGGYALMYLGYLVMPVIGPQFSLADQYVNNVRGFGFAGTIQDYILAQQTNKTDCFPSGHTALSWMTALMALRLGPQYRTYGKICLVVAILITLATVYLRYHYIVDLMAAVPLILFGLYWGDYFKLGKRARIESEA